MGTPTEGNNLRPRRSETTKTKGQQMNSDYVLQSNSNPKFLRKSITSIGTSALLGLSAVMLPLQQDAKAQATCGNLLAAGPIISPISGSRVVVGQVVTITQYRVTTAPGNCLFRNGDAFMAYPNATVVQTMDNFSLDPAAPFLKDCFGTAGNADSACLAFTTTYTVSAADVNKDLTIIMPPRGQ